MNSEALKLDYSFRPEEIVALAKIFRANQDKLPDDISDFASAVQAAVYNALSIDEAETFYS